MAKAIFIFLSGWAWAGFFLVRLAERLLPLRVLDLFLWPVAAIWGATEIGKRRGAIAAWRRLPELLPTPSRAQIWFWHALKAHHARFVYLFPDRLAEPRWQGRCKMTGPVPLRALRQTKGRIVFASLHFGAFDTLPYLLRAHGLPVTTLVGRAASRHRLKARQYALSPPSDTPVVLPVGERAHLRQALAGARHLLVMMDVKRGRQIEVEWERLVYRLASGPMRIAAATDAELIPCLTTVGSGWNFTIHFGRPVPRQFLGRSPDLESAALHLLQEFLAIVRQAPAQSGYRFLTSIREAEPSLSSSAPE
ncbi:MAG: hypothetical protein ACR2MW_07330 [Chthoniobacterales bacterium]